MEFVLFLTNCVGQNYDYFLSEWSLAYCWKQESSWEDSVVQKLLKCYIIIHISYWFSIDINKTLLLINSDQIGALLRHTLHGIWSGPQLTASSWFVDMLHRTSNVCPRDPKILPSGFVPHFLSLYLPPFFFFLHEFYVLLAEVISKN